MFVVLSRIAAPFLVALATGCLVPNPIYLGPASDEVGTSGTDTTSARAESGATTGPGTASNSNSNSGSASASTTNAPGTSSAASTSADSADSSGGVTTGNPNDPFCDANDPDLVACYEFENDVGSGVVEDGSGYGHDGVASKADADDGVRGLALSTNGNSEVRIPNTADLELVSALTVELWIFPRQVATGAFQHIVDKNNHYTTGIAPNGHLRCRTPDGLIEAPSPAAEDEWTHLACVFDGDTLTMYVDGIVEVQAPMQPQAASTNRDVMLGSSPDGDWPYDGLLDDLRIWRRPLSQQEIANSYGR